MTELNKDSFFFYFMKKTGGLHDPALLTKTLELLKEWLPDEVDVQKLDIFMMLIQMGKVNTKTFL